MNEYDYWIGFIFGLLAGISFTILLFVSMGVLK